MRVEQTAWTQAAGWDPAPPGTLGSNASLVLLFGDTALLKERPWIEEIGETYPDAHVIGCSTAGEIAGTRVHDGSVVLTAIQFTHTRVATACLPVETQGEDFEVGARLAHELDPEELVHVFVLSDGLRVNGTNLVRGLTEHLPAGVTLTGGLSADGERFEETLVLSNCTPQPGLVAIAGLYGSRLQIGCGSLGGWDSFGPERVITKSEGNVLYELDGRSALELYRRYLGEHASGLPATGLLFPLSVRTPDNSTGVVRTILSVDEERQSLTFAGDVPEGWYARLMKANVDRLIDGAIGAARTSTEGMRVGTIRGANPDLAILISCFGRRLVLKQRVEEEVEGVRDVLGCDTVLSGFYSYGEISPFTPEATCELHNQTMTITTISERT